MTQQEVRYYKGIYKVEIIKQSKHSVLVEAQEDISLSMCQKVLKGEQFLTVTTLLHKQKRE